MEKIELTTDPALTALLPEKFGAAIRIVMPDSHEYEEICETPPGHPENPMTDTEIEEKFIRLSKGVFSDKKLQRIFSGIGTLEELSHLTDFMKLFSIEDASH